MLILFALLPIAGCRSLSRSDIEQGAGAERVRTFAAKLRVVLEWEADAPVELDGIMVAELPSSYRLQLWKLSQPVLDITRTRRSTWVMNRLAGHEMDHSQMSQSGPLRDNIALITSGLRMTQRLPRQALGERRCDRGRISAGTVECCGSATAAGKVSCTLSRSHVGPVALATFAAFRDIGSLHWPSDIAVSSEDGSIRMLVDEIEINEPLGVDAFQPPRDARKLR